MGRRGTTKKFSGKKNLRRSGALARLKIQFEKYKKRLSSEGFTEQDKKSYFSKEKEIAILESRIQEQEVAESRRTKVWRSNTASLRTR